jgi:UDP:flavonoid glycosyltransferase YjiC (YdhE family)
MSVLCASMPADGHFKPLTGIAAHLSARGHDVRWYAGPEYGRKLDTLGMTWFPYRHATEVTGENLNDLFPERAGLKGPRMLSFDLEKFFVANVDHHFRDIVSLRSDFPFDVMLCDGAMYVEKLVAERLGLPVFAISLTTVMPDNQGPPPFFGLRPARTVVGRTHHRIVRRMLASTIKRGTLAYNEILMTHDLAPIPRDGFPHVPMASARRVFLNGSPGLEFPGYRPPENAEYVGPLLPARAALPRDTPPLPPAVLDPGTKVVAVSQGTVDHTDPTKLTIPTLQALQDGPHVVVATTGGAGTADLRQRFATPNIVIEDFIDYDVLFPHVDVFVTNGGFGSVLAAVRHGVPLVAAGKTEGKNDIAARIGHNQLGIDLRKERPKPANIRAAVSRALADRPSPPTSTPCARSSSPTTLRPGSRQRSKRRCFRLDTETFCPEAAPPAGPVTTSTSAACCHSIGPWWSRASRSTVSAWRLPPPWNNRVSSASRPLLTCRATAAPPASTPSPTCGCSSAGAMIASSRR